MVEGLARSTCRIVLPFPILYFLYLSTFFLHFQNLAVLVIPNILKEPVFYVIQEFEVVRISREDYAFLMSEWTQSLEFRVSIGGSLDLLSVPVTNQGLAHLKIKLFQGENYFSFNVCF